jgi:hypothetical protein
MGASRIFHSYGYGWKEHEQYVPVTISDLMWLFMAVMCFHTLLTITMVNLGTLVHIKKVFCWWWLISIYRRTTKGLNYQSGQNKHVLIDLINYTIYSPKLPIAVIIIFSLLWHLLVPILTQTKNNMSHIMKNNLSYIMELLVTHDKIL